MNLCYYHPHPLYFSNHLLIFVFSILHGIYTHITNTPSTHITHLSSCPVSILLFILTSHLHHHSHPHPHHQYQYQYPLTTSNMQHSCIHLFIYLPSSNFHTSIYQADTLVTISLTHSLTPLYLYLYQHTIHHITI